MRRILVVGLMLVLSGPASAQVRVLAYLGSSSPQTNWAMDDSWAISEYWKAPINVGLGAEWMMTKGFGVASTWEIGYADFDGFGSLVGIPEIGVKSSTGSPSRIYRAFVEGKLLGTIRGPVGISLSTGAGYVVEDIGGWEVVFADLNGPDFRHIAEPRARAFWAHTAGTGLRVTLSRKVAFDLAGNYYSNYRDRFWVNWRGGLVYTLRG